MDYHLLIGTPIGPGPGIVIDKNRIDAYCLAIGLAASPVVPLLFVVSLIPALGSGIELELPTPAATVNYGLNRVEQLAAVQIGDRLRATFTISSIEELGRALRVVRAVAVSTQTRHVVSAETVTLLLPDA